MIRDFNPSDLDAIIPLDVYAREIDTKKAILGVYESPNVICKTLLAVHEEILAILGAFIDGTTMTLFAYVDKNVLRYPIRYHRESERFFMDVVRQLGIRRVQSVIFADNEEAIKQHLAWGFKIDKYIRSRDMNDELLLVRNF